MTKASSNVRKFHGNGAAPGSAKQMIVEETIRLCTQVYKNPLRAVVLTGSVARNEGTFVASTDGVNLLGDAEFFVVFHDAFPLPRSADLKVLEEQVEERLRRRRLVANISLSGVQSRYFRGVRPSIFGYELRTCGEVVWGDRDVLRLIPAFGEDEIPLEDGWRLLANRLVEQLEGFDDLSSGRPILSAETHYRTVKLYLDMGTSLLVFSGKYAPTYAERAKALSVLADAIGETPAFPLARFAQDVAAMTRWKLGSAPPELTSAREFWERAVEYAEQLWCWELARLTGRPADAGVTDLFRTWLQRQPLAARVRGWLYVARREGLRAGFARCPRWLSSAMIGSPRYLVYSIAAPLVFSLRHVNGKRDTVKLNSGTPDRLTRLPVSFPVHARANGLDADVVAKLLLENYRQFLVETRT